MNRVEALKECAACGAAAQGNASIHRDGFGEGPEVALCDACGLGATPTCEQIWSAIESRKVIPLRIRPAPIIAIDGAAPICRVTLKARPEHLGGPKLTVRRRTSRYSWRTRSWLQGAWT